MKPGKLIFFLNCPAAENLSFLENYKAQKRRIISKQLEGLSDLVTLSGCI